jgi:hypothetical protein
MPVLSQLIHADIERLRGGRAARARGERGTRANGAHMGCPNWHVDAVIRLDPVGAETVLLELLGEPEYEAEASKGLARLAQIHPSAVWGYRGLDYTKIWEARAGRHNAAGDEVRSQRCAAAIGQRIQDLLCEQRASGNPDFLTRRLKGLAGILAVLDGRNTTTRVLEIMALPCEWDSWMRIHALEALLICGAPLPTEAAFHVLNPAIEHTLTQGLYNQQNCDLLEHCLCLLDPFRGKPLGPCVS